MKGLFFGVLLIVIVGLGGFVYRNAVEHPLRPIRCPLDAMTCPDGTAVLRTGSSCVFPQCPPPNVSLTDINTSFALPAGFSAIAFPDATSVAAYGSPATASSTHDATLVIRRYAIDPSATVLATIQKTALSGTSGLPVSATSFTSTVLGNHRFTVVSIERFEGTIDTAYYLARNVDVLRFDAIDTNVMNWTDKNLDTTVLPAHSALVKLLTTLQGQ